MLYVKDFQQGDTFYDRAIREALQEAKKQQEPVTVMLPEGDVSIRFPIELDDVHNLHLQGNNTRFLVHDSCTLFELSDSDHLTFSDFTVDYTVLNFTMAVLQESNTHEAVVRINDGYEFSDEMIVSSFVEFDPATGAPLRGGNDLYPLGDVESVEIVSQEERLLKIRFKGQIKVSPAGTNVVISQRALDVTGINVKGCSQITFRNLTFYMVPGMGMACTDSDDITIDNYNMLIDRDTDRLFSACRDGFHFLNCGGTVSIRNCTLENLGDDALNIHSSWMRIRRKIADNKVAVTTMRNGCSCNRLHEVGNVIEFRDNSLHPIGTAVLTEIEEQASEVIFTFDQPLTEEMQSALLYDLTRSPELVFENNTVTNIRGHGVFVQTDRASIVRNNRFVNNFFAAIKMVATNDESVPAANLVIADNYIGGSSYFAVLGDILTDSWADSPWPGLFRNIEIRNNTIEKTSDVGATICINGAENFVIEGNTLSNIAKVARSDFSDRAECGIWIGHSKDIILRDNRVNGRVGSDGWIHFLDGVDEQTVTVEQ